ncbi:MAG: helicase-related protein [Bryobacteraceae bacterium]
MPTHLGDRDLYITVLTGEALQHLLSIENIVELGRRKGTYLLRVLEALNQHDHIIVCSPDLLGYVAQRCYSVSGNFYNRRWRDELELKLGDHQIVIDEYHFYDPYTYLNLAGTLDRLGTSQSLCLSATGTQKFFPDAKILALEDLPHNGDKNVASHPIDVSIHQGEMPEPHASGMGQSIWFYHSAISAHESAESLRCRGVRVTEWTGIRKARDDAARLVVATSAAEVGLDLPFRRCHTEFWGNSWEVPSMIQRIGRVGRSAEAGRSEAHVWVTGREPRLLSAVFNGCARLSKAEFSDRLHRGFGEALFRPDDYVSYYLWDEARTKELRRFWQVPLGAARLRFHFRPPNSQAVFNWTGIRFAYDTIPIANRYELEKVSDVTDLPFWHEMGYSEFRVVEALDKRTYRQRYEGKKDKEHRRCFYDE